MDTKSKADNTPSDIASVLTAVAMLLDRMDSLLEQRKQPTSWSDLPITLGIPDMCAATGMGPTAMRALWHSKGFPRIPKRYGAMELKADKELFRAWWLEYQKNG